MQDNDGQLVETRMSRLLCSCGVPADDIKYHDEIIVFKVRHVCPQDIGLHFQLDVLGRNMTGEKRLVNYLRIKHKSMNTIYKITSHKTEHILPQVMSIIWSEDYSMWAKTEIL